MSTRLVVLCAVVASVRALSISSLASGLRTLQSAIAPQWPSSTPVEDWVLASSNVQTGVCKFYDVAKGFGFITQDGEYGKDARSDIFVHHSDLQSFSLAPGQRLSFRIARHGGDGRVKATDVQGVRGGVSSYGDEEEIDALFDELFSDVAPAQRDEELF